MKTEHLIVVFAGLVGAQSGCNQGIQALLAPLRNVPAAQSLCSSRYPVTTPTSTVTSTSSTTYTPTVTATVTTTVTTTVTVTSTYGAAVSVRRAKRATPTTTTTTTSRASVIATTPTPKDSKSSATGKQSAANPTTLVTATSAQKGGSEISMLLSQASAVVSTFCTCAEHTPSPSTTTTITTVTITGAPTTTTATSTSTATQTATVTQCGAAVCSYGCGCYVNAESGQMGCYGAPSDYYGLDCAYYLSLGASNVCTQGAPQGRPNCLYYSGSSGSGGCGSSC